MCRFGFTMDTDGNCSETTEGSGSESYITSFLIKETDKIETGLEDN